MTRLGKPVPPQVQQMHKDISRLCRGADYKVIDASKMTTGGDFLLKIWKSIASTPLAIAICHEEIPHKTQLNIFYEVGVAQALGKETIIIKSPAAEIPSDFVRSGYIEYDRSFNKNFKAFLGHLEDQADHYETVADQLEKDPVLAIDYLKRAFLLTGKEHLRRKAKKLLSASGLRDRAKNSVELIASNF